MATAAALSVASQYKLLKTWVDMSEHLATISAAYVARLGKVLAPEEIEIARERDWLYRHACPVSPIADDFVVDVLACAYGQNRPRSGAYTPATNYHSGFCPQPSILYNHGRSDDDQRIEQRGSIIGRVVNRTVRADGMWFRAKLDRDNPWAVRAWEAAKIGRCRVSTMAMQALIGTDAEGHITDYPIMEISLFHSAGTVRLAAHAYAVAVPASVAIPHTQPGEVPAALLWSVDRSLRCDKDLNNYAKAMHYLVGEM